MEEASAETKKVKEEVVDLNTVNYHLEQVEFYIKSGAMTETEAVQLFNKLQSLTTYTASITGRS